MTRTSVLLLFLATILCSSGCIMGIRKVIGTIQGPRSTIDILERHMEFPLDAKVGSVALATDGEGSGDAEGFNEFKSSLVGSLQSAGLYDSSRGSVTLVATLLTNTRLPARQKIVLEISLSMPVGELGEARITTDVQGLADREKVVADMSESVLLFIRDLQQGT